MARKMNNEEIRAYIDGRVGRALSTTDGELRSERELALNAYYGKPMGNEIEGRSQVVSRDIMDTIEWMMPSLMRVFSAKNAIMFDPVGEEDTEQAKQETGYVNHVLWKKNPGFMIVHNSLKDGLMQKNGYVKYYWDKSEKVKFEQFEGLTEEQLILTLQALEQKGTVEIVGKDQDESGLWTIKCRIKKNYGCLKIENLPPDEVIVDCDCRGGIKEAKGAGHMRKITRSDLMEMGYSRDVVNGLTSYTADSVTQEARARDTINESTNKDQDESEWANYELTLLEWYCYLDCDGDGIAELRKFLLPGDGVLENEEWDEIPFESWTPLIIPHRHSGLGIYDIMEELWRIKTALQRGLLDNVYFTMNDRKAYDKNVVDVSTLQINRPGGHVAVDGPPAGAVVSLPVNPMAGQLLPVIDYFDQVRETRTGVGRMTSGVDADVLKQSTRGAYSDAKSAANQRIEMIARIYAETFMASLAQSIHKMLSKHQSDPVKFMLNKKWVTVNPVEWMERTDMTVTVGLGNSSHEEVRNNLMLMGQAQERAAAIPGLVQPQNVYNLISKVADELGLGGEELITDPKSPEFEQFMAKMQPPADPTIEATKIKTASDEKIAAMKVQSEGMRTQADSQVSLAVSNTKNAMEAERHRMEMELKAQLDMMEKEHSAKLDALKLQSEAQVQTMSLATQQQIADAQNQNKLMLADLEASHKAELQAAQQQHEKEMLALQGEQQLKVEKERAKNVQALPKPEKEAKKEDKGEVKVAEAMTKLADQLAKPREVVRDESGKITGLK